MALFSKPPAKKPEGTRKPEPKARHAPAQPASARQLVKQGPAPKSEASAKSTNVIEMAPAKAAIEIEHVGTGLCAVLENAALLFASSQAQAARELLDDGVNQDDEARTSSLAWLALFDLLRRAGDKPAFDKLALQYVVQFERSAPGWEEMGGPGPGQRPAAAGGYIAVSGKLTGASGPQLEALRRLGPGGSVQARLDLAAVNGFDDAGSRLLADALGGVRRRRAPLVLERAEKLRQSLEAAVNHGRDAGEGPWLLLLELLQWQGEQATFDDRAVEYAVTFELSPPSWEPPVHTGPPMPADAADAASAGDADVLEWKDEIKGAPPKLFAELADFAEARSSVVLDMTLVERMDFVSGGALGNALQQLESQRKKVQIVGASPIIRALLLLIGVRADLFVRKAA
jgi:anti-anti-sigma regulatory factor